MGWEDDPTLLKERADKLIALGPIPAWWRLFARREWRNKRQAILLMDCSVFAAMYREFYTPEYVAALAARPSSLAAIYKRPYSVA